MVVRRLLPLLLLALLTACQKDLIYEDWGDVREIRLSYTTPATLEYREDIDTLRWLLFDGEGRFRRELSMKPRQRQYFDPGDLPDGRYTVVCIANATSRSFLDNDLKTLNDLTLWADTRQQEGWYANVDHLFWQKSTFTLSMGYSEVAVPLVDVHCHLHVRLWWKGVPETSGSDYSLRLYGVPLACRVGTTGLTLGGLPHPEMGDSVGEHRLAVEPYNFVISGEFVTMRWTDDHVPQLQLWCGDQPATPLIDLYKVFSEWHWSPDRTVAQDYWLNVVINLDGSVTVSVGGKARIVDWQDGGTIGGGGTYK